MSRPMAKLAFAELAVCDRIALLDSLLAQLSADQVRVAVNDPESLGVLAEARLIGLTRSDELARYLPASEVSRLGALVSEALVARLPEPT
jgi:hypothetical protein